MKKAEWLSAPVKETRWAAQQRLRLALCAHWVLSGKTSGQYQQALRCALDAGIGASATLFMLSEDQPKENDFEALVENELRRFPDMFDGHGQRRRVVLKWLTQVAQNGDMESATDTIAREAASRIRGESANRAFTLRLNIVEARLIGNGLQGYLNGVDDGLNADPRENCICIWESTHFEGEPGLHDLMSSCTAIAGIEDESLRVALLPPAARLLRRLGRGTASTWVDVIDADRDDESALPALVELLRNGGPARRRDRREWHEQCLVEARQLPGLIPPGSLS